eukprot:403356687
MQSQTDSQQLQQLDCATYMSPVPNENVQTINLIDDDGQTPIKGLINEEQT